MERFYFNAKLSEKRAWLNGGNVELYSLRKSFESGVMWKFTISPTESLSVEGYVEKIENGQVVKFEDNEAKSAIYGIFLRAKKPTPVPPMNDFPVFKGKDVAFTLRMPCTLQSELKEYQHIQKFSQLVLGRNVSYRTNNIKRETRVSCVRGLLTLDQVLPLEECAEILAAANFPREMITWLTYCTNVEAWTRNFRSISVPDISSLTLNEPPVP